MNVYCLKLQFKMNWQSFHDSGDYSKNGQLFPKTSILLMKDVLLLLKIAIKIEKAKLFDVAIDFSSNASLQIFSFQLKVLRLTIVIHSNNVNDSRLIH